MLRFGSSAVLALLLAMLAPNVAHAICPAGFLEVGSGASPLGCIQQTEHANGTLFPNYFTATEICFDQYGGRLPGSGGRCRPSGRAAESASAREGVSTRPV